MAGWLEWVYDILSDTVAGVANFFLGGMLEDDEDSEPSVPSEPEDPRDGEFDLRLSEVGANNAVRTFSSNVPDDFVSVPDFIESYWGRIMDVVDDEMSGDFRITFVVIADMVSPDGGRRVMYFRANNVEFERSMTGDDLRDRVIELLMDNFRTARFVGSGWAIERITAFNLTSTVFTPIPAGCFIECPRWIINKRAVVNVRPPQDDGKCFGWAITRGLYPGVSTTPGRVDTQLSINFDRIDWSSIKFPFSVIGGERYIRAFERANGVSISIMAISDEEDKLYPVRRCKSGGFRVCLLLIRDGDRYHYALVRKLGNLLRDQLRVPRNRASYVCTGCISHYTSEAKLDRHMKFCVNNRECLVELPDKGKTMSFTKHYMKNKIPLKIYYDFESCTCPGDGDKWTQIHKASGFSMIAVHNLAKFGAFSYTASDPNDNVAYKFVLACDEYLRKCTKVLSEEFGYLSEPNDDTERDLFDNEINCSYCECPLLNNKGESDRVLSRHPITKEFVGVDHEECSMNRCYTRNIPFIAHNSMGYDVRLFMKELNRSRGSMSCIAKNRNNVKTVSKHIWINHRKHAIKFIDSYAFLSSSLGGLVEALTEDQLVYTRANTTDVEFALAQRKGVFPYDWFFSLDKLSQTSLPSKEEFYSLLHDKGVKDDDYKFAKRVWGELGFATMREFHDFYLKLDTLLLADVMETYSDLTIDTYGIEPFWSISLPGAMWHAFLKMSKVNLPLIYDYEMLDIFESSIRGGMVCGMKWYSKANNKDMPDHKPEKPTINLEYYDINSMYPCGMTQPLPVGDFEIMTEEELSHWPDFTCFIVADWEYPEDLHDSHNDLPLAPYRRDGRLMTDFYDRVDYPTHYVEAKCYLRYGMKIKVVKSGVKFREEAYMKDFIMTNVELRKKWKHIKYKDETYKKSNNSVYGKTVENNRGRIVCEIVSDRDKYVKMSSKPNYVDSIALNDKTSFVLMSPTKVIMDKPLYVGAAILAYAKTKLYDFHYGFMKKVFGDRAKALYTDTDSIIYEIRSDDYHKEIEPHLSEHFDTSNYPKNHPFYSLDNKGVLGMMKDEAVGETITEFLCVAPKSYLVMAGDRILHRKAKGTPKASQERRTYDEYKRVVFGKEEITDTVYRIGGNLTDVGLIKSERVALANNHAKRHDIKDSFETYAHGHWRIKIEIS